MPAIGSFPKLSTSSRRLRSDPARVSSSPCTGTSCSRPGTNRRSAMPDIKIACLPDRTPVRLSVTVLPELHQALADYARFYAQAYGREEKVIDLVPHMLAAW